MKNFKRILCITLSAILVSVLSASIFSVSAATTYTFDCGIDKASSGPFKLAGYIPSTNEIIDVETSPRATWSDDWHGYWLADGSTYLFVRTQSGTEATGGMGFIEETGFIDFSPRYGKSAAAVFTAPEAGEYYFKGEFAKLEQWGDTSEFYLSAHKGSTTLTTTNFEGPVTNYQLKTIEGTVTLAKGETLVVAANTSTDGAKSREITIMSLNVTLTGTSSGTGTGSGNNNPATTDTAVSFSIALASVAICGFVVIVSKKRREND